MRQIPARILAIAVEARQPEKSRSCDVGVPRGPAGNPAAADQADDSHGTSAYRFAIGQPIKGWSIARNSPGASCVKVPVR